MYIRGFFRIMIDAYLVAYARRRRAAACVRAAGVAIAVAAGVALFACGVDRLLPLPAGVRVGCLLLTMIAPALIVARPVFRLFRRFDPVAAAAAVERQHPVFAHRLVTLATPGGSADLRAALLRDVAGVIVTVGPARVSWRPAARAWGTAVVLGIVAAGLWRWAWLDLPDLARRLARPTGTVAAVTTVRLNVRPGDATVVVDHPFGITATATGLAASDAVALHVSDDAGQTWAERPMPAGDRGYAATVADVDHDLRYYVTAGPAVSRTYAVRVVRPPAVVAIRYRVNDGPTVTAADGVVDAPAGAAVTVDVVATQSLRQAAMTVGPDRVELSATADPSIRRGRFVAGHDEPIAVSLTAVDGTPGSGPPSARVRVGDGDADAQQRAYRAALQGR